MDDTTRTVDEIYDAAYDTLYDAAYDFLADLDLPTLRRLHEHAAVPGVEDYLLTVVDDVIEERSVAIDEQAAAQ
jgi:hypothetical protein